MEERPIFTAYDPSNADHCDRCGARLGEDDLHATCDQCDFDLDQERYNDETEASQS